MAYWNGSLYQRKKQRKMTVDEEEDFKDEFQDCLENVKVAGSFASALTETKYVNPGLTLEKIGTIGLPLATRDAQALAVVCKQAPFGRREETIIDETVRKTWELDGTEFSCNNPAWQSFVDSMAEHAMNKLGVKIPARAEQYKLLLYEEGAFFKPHRDSEKVPGMFGTMVLCLPSTHTGGEVFLVHGGKERKIETAATSAFDMSMLAWYSDVQHEIRPVTSGHRLVITYNLVQDPTLPKQAAGEINADADKLTAQLQKWTNGFPRFKYLMFPLEHKYTQTSLSLSNLKGRDAACCRTLDRVCSQNGYWWFFALLTRQKPEEEYDDHYDTDDDIEQFAFDDMFIPSGEHVSLELDEPELDQMLTDTDEFYRRDADSDEEGEWTGNEGMANKQRYHDIVTVMVKKQHIIEKISEQPKDADADDIRALFEVIRGDQTSDIKLLKEAYKRLLRGMMFRICDLRGPPKHGWYWPTSNAAFDHEKQLEQLAAVFHDIADECHSQGIGDISTDILSDAMKRPTPTSLVMTLTAKQIAQEVMEGKGQVWDRWLTVQVPETVTYTYTNERAKAFEVTGRALHADSALSFQRWEQETLVSLIVKVDTYTASDATPLRELLDVIESKTYLEVILPKLATCSDVAALQRFLIVLGSPTEATEDFRKEMLLPTYKRILPTIIPISKLSLTDLTAEVLGQHSGYGVFMYRDVIRPMNLGAAASAIIEIMQNCVQLALTEEAGQLLRAALPDLSSATLVDWANWRSLFLFAEYLVQSVLNHKCAQLYGISGPFLAHLLHEIVTKHSQARPRVPRDWYQPNVDRGPEQCHCEPCQDLVRFLLSRRERSGRFKYAEKTRKHLRYSLRRHDDFQFSTGKHKSPHTLIISKTKNQFERDLQRWKDDVNSMQCRLNDMRNNFTADLLGGDILEVVGLENALRAAGAAEGIILPTAPPPEGSAAAHQNVLQPSVGAQNVPQSSHGAGVKRKLDFVDLTED